MKLAHQQTPMSFYHGVKKIGEGAYSDVFAFNKEDSVIKLIPFGGTFIFHNRKQLRVHQMLTEVIATQAVSQLNRRSVGNCTQNFVQLKGISVLTGSMPSFLLAACRVFERNGKCRGYKIGKLFFIYFKFGRLSVFAQTVLAMAVAERQLCLEHRDLHMDNVLIPGCDTDAPSSTLDGTVHQPCAGPSVSIIDFTFSRLNMSEFVTSRAVVFSNPWTLIKHSSSSRHFFLD
ncbi:unnamed protein product [Hymenolepis diminuta]|uniref:Protein kinase domain-containing protein n=1 Tax=Hymenolepis diminuta TaxID=6216 RepID=A0A3P6ZQ04_HYMDI|nr:unnamed protein product [Hymenolepis diminuta]